VARYHLSGPSDNEFPRPRSTRDLYQNPLCQRNNSIAMRTKSSEPSRLQRDHRALQHREETGRLWRRWLQLATGPNGQGARRNIQLAPRMERSPLALRLVGSRWVS
jgi:hypothetical protein